MIGEINTGEMDGGGEALKRFNVMDKGAGGGVPLELARKGGGRAD